MPGCRGLYLRIGQLRADKSGSDAGVPDLMLFKALPDGRNEVLFLEIKTEAGKLSLSQQKWHSGLTVKISYGWEETERIIKEFAVLSTP